MNKKTEYDKLEKELYIIGINDDRIQDDMDKTTNIEYLTILEKQRQNNSNFKYNIIDKLDNIQEEIDMLKIDIRSYETLLSTTVQELNSNTILDYNTRRSLLMFNINGSRLSSYSYDVQTIRDNFIDFIENRIILGEQSFIQFLISYIIPQRSVFDDYNNNLFDSNFTEESNDKYVLYLQKRFDLFEKLIKLCINNKFLLEMEKYINKKYYN